jgi:kynurenine formamidase
MAGKRTVDRQLLLPPVNVLAQRVFVNVWLTQFVQHDFPGLAPESVHWLADKGCKLFGVEAVSPAPEGELNFKAHNICGERGITHMEAMDNLDQVVGKGRFKFVGFPLKLKGCSGSPIRAVAIFE